MISSNLGLGPSILNSRDVLIYWYLDLASVLRVPYADCEYNLGNLYLRSGLRDKAEAHFR
jgi:hypothetical protein